MREFWPDGVFACVQGYVEPEYRKPDPHYLLRISDSVGAVPEQTVLVGDTPTDIETARRAGAIGVGVTWGFRTRADLSEANAERIIDQPNELVAAIGLR